MLEKKPAIVCRKVPELLSDFHDFNSLSELGDHKWYTLFDIIILVLNQYSLFLSIFTSLFWKSSTPSFSLQTLFFLYCLIWKAWDSLGLSFKKTD